MYKRTDFGYTEGENPEKDGILLRIVENNEPGPHYLNERQIEIMREVFGMPAEESAQLIARILLSSNDIGGNVWIKSYMYVGAGTLYVNGRGDHFVLSEASIWDRPGGWAKYYKDGKYIGEFTSEAEAIASVVNIPGGLVRP